MAEQTFRAETPRIPREVLEDRLAGLTATRSAIHKRLIELYEGVARRDWSGAVPGDGELIEGLVEQIDRSIVEFVDDRGLAR